VQLLILEQLLDKLYLKAKKRREEVEKFFNFLQLEEKADIGYVLTQDSLYNEYIRKCDKVAQELTWYLHIYDVDKSEEKNSCHVVEVVYNGKRSSFVVARKTLNQELGNGGLILVSTSVKPMTPLS
jgi:hypothetical protein